VELILIRAYIGQIAIRAKKQCVAIVASFAKMMNVDCNFVPSLVDTRINPYWFVVFIYVVNARKKNHWSFHNRTNVLAKQKNIGINVLIARIGFAMNVRMNIV
jgi:hypothetical protein